MRIGELGRRSTTTWDIRFFIKLFTMLKNFCTIKMLYKLLFQRSFKVFELYKDYIEVVSKIKVLTERKNSLRKKILIHLNEQGKTQDESNNIKASKSVRRKVSYDKDGIESALKSLGFSMEDIYKKELDMDKVEQLVAKGKLSPNVLMKFAEIKETETLNVKEI